jgi:MFS family permease
MSAHRTNVAQALGPVVPVTQGGRLEMSAIRRAMSEFLEAARSFSRPARFYLGAEFLMWTAHGIFAVLFNLYLVEAGGSERFVGRAVSSSAFGLVVAALPAGWLADRWGRRRTLLLGVLLEAVGHIVRALWLAEPVVLGAGFVTGLGQAFFQIAAAPFLTDHSTPRERTHLFSTFFASALLAGVVGNALGGALPPAVRALVPGLGLFEAYRVALLAGALLAAAAALPLMALRGLAEPRHAHEDAPPPPHEEKRLWPIALNSLLLGSGAGLVIPFMNLYFHNRFAVTSADIGLYFSIAQVFTAIASLAAPAIGARFGRLRTAVASELLSLPFLLTLGTENHLPVAVAAFWVRATLMQAATPLLQAYVMEVLPPALRARSSSLNNMVWNLGWAVSSSVAGLIIERFGYSTPFYITATLYATAAITFYRAFRGTREPGVAPVRLSEEAKGLRGDGPGSG